MAPKKSLRLASKFKSRIVEETVTIEDESSSSSAPSSSSSQDTNLNELRSKKSHEERHTMQEKSSGSIGEASSDEERTISEPRPESEGDSEGSLRETPTKKSKPSPSPAKTSKQPTKRRRTSGKVLECAYIDFKFFKANGFEWNHWLDRIGCRKLCGLSEVFDGEVVNEFYNNLELVEGWILKSRIFGKSVKIERNDLIECFDMKDVKDDSRLFKLQRNELFREINDGVGTFEGKDIFSTEFELLVRLWHKVVVDCLLPKNGSSTTISKEEATVILAIKKKLLIDMPSLIIKHLWRTQGNKPYGNLIMKLLKFKKVTLKKEVAAPIGLKKIGELNLKRMNILVFEKLWFTKDGSWYRHPRFNKVHFDWQKVKSLAEGELVLESESDSEGAPKQETARRPGKEAAIPKKKRSYKPRSEGKLEINEGKKTTCEDSESESDSEGNHPHEEPSSSTTEAKLIKVLEEKVQKMQQELTNSILDAINNLKEELKGTSSSQFGFKSDPKPSTPLKSDFEGTDHTTDQPSDVPCDPPSDAPKNQSSPPNPKNQSSLPNPKSQSSSQAQETEPPIVILSEEESDHGPKRADTSQVPREHDEKDQSAALPTLDVVPRSSTETMAAQLLTSLQQNPNLSLSKPRTGRFKTCARKSVPYVRRKK